MKDPRVASYYSLGGEETFLLEQLDGGKTVGAICAAFEARWGVPLSAGEVGECPSLGEAGKAAIFNYNRLAGSD